MSRKAALLFATWTAWDIMHNERLKREHGLKPNAAPFGKVISRAMGMALDPDTRRLSGVLFDSPLYIESQMWRPDPIVILMGTGDGVYKQGMEDNCILLDLA